MCLCFLIGRAAIHPISHGIISGPIQFLMGSTSQRLCSTQQTSHRSSICPFVIAVCSTLGASSGVRSSHGHGNVMMPNPTSKSLKQHTPPFNPPKTPSSVRWEFCLSTENASRAWGTVLCKTRHWTGLLFPPLPSWQVGSGCCWGCCHQTMPKYIDTEVTKRNGSSRLGALARNRSNNSFFAMSVTVHGETGRFWNE
jgi:hypothetical protein